MGLLLLSASWAMAADSPPAPVRSAAQMSARIDELLAARWEESGITPAAGAVDHVFLRRIYLDLAGRIPRISEARSFLADQRSDRRQRLIDRLLDSSDFANRMAAIWRTALLDDVVDPRRVQMATLLEAHLRTQFLENQPFDQIARDLLLAEGQPYQARAGIYLASLQAKPEKIAASSSRVFLGVQIQCAECHDHPFDHWTRRNFWEYAAFFARLEQPTNPNGFVSMLREKPSGELTIPDTEETILPRFLSGESVDANDDRSRRRILADWMTSADNDFFARAIANRLWSQLFGRGIVHPIDDLGQHNPASHERLLSELADFFASSGFDIKQTLRALANSRAYQRASSHLGEAAPPESFAQMQVKPLTAEQLFDCLGAAVIKKAPPTPQYAGRRLDPAKFAFLTKFQTTGASDEYQGGVLQALSLMNGAQTDAAVRPQQSDLLQALAAPIFTTEDRLETIYLATLTRTPSDSEKNACLLYIEQATEESTALGDILWALLNSAEFNFNH